MTALSIRKLTKRYQSVVALKTLDLDVGEGEFVSLLGPSGCGKTTTLRCVAGFELPDEGAVWFGGRETTWLPPEARDIGMVFQSYALFPHMTVRENLSFGLEMRRIGADERARRIAQVLDMVQLTGREDRFPRQLSGGQQQRVALARALVIEPELLLLDEPLANLDAILRDEMRYFIRSLQQRVRITSLYVTHDQAEAMVMSDRIVVMFDGEAAQVGPPRDIYERPASRRVASFIGRSNLIDGTIEKVVGDTYEIQSAHGSLRAKGPAGLAAGAAVTILVRPESISLGAGEGAANRLAGTVAQATYLGNALHLAVRLDGGQQVELDVPSDARFQPGETITLTFAAERAWVLSA